MTALGTAPPLAVMAYTVLEEARRDLEGTLARLARIGFVGLETYGIVEQYGPVRVHDAAAAAGLVLTSAHTPFPAGDDAARLLDEAEELGAPVLVWSLEQAEFASVDALLRGLDRVNEAAERAAERGLTIAYHNHFAEFAEILDGMQAYDRLCAELDPRVVLELDAYWARMGGADPGEVLGRVGDRVRLIHVKDGPAASYQDYVLVPIGDGEMDWAHILTVPSGLRWHVLELERLAVDTFEALERSYRYLVGRGLSTGSVAVDPADVAEDRA